MQQNFQSKYERTKVHDEPGELGFKYAILHTKAHCSTLILHICAIRPSSFPTIRCAHQTCAIQFAMRS